MDTSKGGGLGKFVTRRGRSVSKRKIPRNSFNKTTVNVYLAISQDSNTFVLAIRIAFIYIKDILDTLWFKLMELFTLRVLLACECDIL